MLNILCVTSYMTLRMRLIEVHVTKSQLRTKDKRWQSKQFLEEFLSKWRSQSGFQCLLKWPNLSSKRCHIHIMFLRVETVSPGRPRCQVYPDEHGWPTYTKTFVGLILLCSSIMFRWSSTVDSADYIRINLVFYSSFVVVYCTFSFFYSTVHISFHFNSFKKFTMLCVTNNR